MNKWNSVKNSEQCPLIINFFPFIAVWESQFQFSFIMEKSFSFPQFFYDFMEISVLKYNILSQFPLWK